MTARDDLDQALSRWMADGPSVVRDAVIDVALDEARHTRQRGGRFAPWRYLTMTATPVGREGRSFAPAIAAAALLLAVAIGAFIVARPDIGIGNFGEPRVYTEDDIVAVVTTPDALTAALVRADVPADFDFFASGSPYDALHLAVGHPAMPSDQRLAITTIMYVGIDEAAITFYDSIGSDGQAVPVGDQGGASMTVLAATYDDAAAADLAFESFVTAYETWEFAAGMEAWDHGDEGAMFPYSLPTDSHGRCFMLQSEPCPQELRVWRQDNLIVTVLQEGEGNVAAEEIVALADERTR